SAAITAAKTNTASAQQYNAKPVTTKPPSLKAATGKEVIIKDSRDLKDAKEFEGIAKALDGERLLVGEKEIRLFGIVTPSISSNYGPQARGRLDAIIKGPVLCKVTDKDRDGRPIAFCGTVDTPDLSYEMLRQGWAMVDRKALKNNSLAEVYEKVEQQAQAQNKGLFAPMPMVNAVPLSNPANTVTVPLVPASAANINKEPAKAEVPKIEAKVEPAKTEVTKELPGTALSLVQTADGNKSPQASAPVVAKAEPIKTEEPKIVEKPQAEKAAAPQAPQSEGFFERYQSIIAGFLWVLGIFAFGGAMVGRDRLQEISKRKALAAALNGELTSARHICRTRARELTRRRHMGEDDTQLRPSQLWPRIRALVYQAHVGSIGLLGSDLARRVAAIYGQCADYAVYYQQTGMQRLPSGAAVSETLSNLADHIDSILDALTYVEQTGKAFIAPSEEGMVAEPAEAESQIAENQEQARNSVNEEARIIKERFERMATSMVGMLGRKREAANSPVVVAGDTSAHLPMPETAPETAEQAASGEAQPSPSQAA
ncbi:MAG: thermonuclease family protein, partial [Alphaproteobacteria bacterium]|nr:thermonuclease family protein [Alphaproteobacteria bacterium]